MTPKRLSGLVAIACMLLLFSCSKKSSSYTKYIPKEANYVVGVDVKSIVQKLDKDSLSVENMMATFKNDGNTKEMTHAMDMYKQFKESGIDWSNRVYIAVNIGNMMNGGSPGVEVVASLSDAAKFETFLKNQPKTKDVKTGEGFSYTGNDEMAIGWTKDAVIFATAEQNRPSYDDYMPDSSGNMTKPPSATTAGNSPAEKLKTYFKLDKATSILEAEGFTDLQGKSGDVVMYSQTGNLSKSFPMIAMMPKVKDLLQGYSTTILNFEDGKVTVESNGYLGDKLASILKKYAGPETDMDLVSNYPSNNVDGVIAFSFKPELFSGFATELGFDGPANDKLRQVGLTMDDVTKAFKGNFAVVVSDFSLRNGDAGKDANSSSFSMPTAKMIFAARIGDKAAFDKILNLAQQQGLIIRNGNNISIASNGQPENTPFVISIANDVLVFASDAATHSAYLAKSQKIGLPSDASGKIKGKAISAFIDIEKILNGFGSGMFTGSDASGKAVMDKAKATFKNVYYTMDNFDGKVLTGKAEVNFVDEKKNSLAQIVHFAIYAYQQEEAEKATRMKEWNSMPDSSATLTPPVISADSVK